MTIEKKKKRNVTKWRCSQPNGDRERGRGRWWLRFRVEEECDKRVWIR
jgi:hypothetical protein